MANILKSKIQMYCLNVLALVGLLYGAEVRLGIILPSKETYPWALSKTIPAIEYAIETVMNNSQLLTNYNLVLNERDSQCSETLGPLAAMGMYVEKSAHVFIGPVCDYAVAPIARFSSHWQIPVITAGALVDAFKDKSEYKLLTRIQGSYAKAGEFVLDMFRIFNWTKVGLMYHDNIRSPNRGKSNCFFTMEAVYYAIQREFSIEPWNEEFDERSKTVDFDDLLKQASQNTRIVVLCASADSVRDIMIKAHELNFDNGEYVFFNIDLFSSKNESERPWYRSRDTHERNEKAKKAYESLMTVTLRKPTSPEYKRFSEEVKRRAKAKYPNFTYGEEEVNSFVGAFHDAVILYALALNETLEADMSISDGKAITQRMWNRTFDGITGTVSIDENGDRNADYSLLDMNPSTKVFEVVANYYGNTRQYKPVLNKQIHWAGGRQSPPPDTPKCGFDGSKCPPESNDTTDTDVTTQSVLTGMTGTERHDVQCMHDRMDVFIPVSLLPGTTSMTWSDSSCPLHNNGTHYVGSVKFGDCHTTVQFTGNSVILENVVRANADSSTNVSVVNWGLSQTVTNVPVRCEYHRESTLEFSYIPIQPHVVLYESDYGQFDLKMTQFQSSQFRSPVSNHNYPISIALNNDVYIKLSVGLTNDTDLALTADRCIATPSPSPLDAVSFALVDHGCAQSANVQVYQSTQTEFRFSFRAFQFTNLPGSTVYLHCHVSVCRASDPTCMRTCQQRTKRAVSAEEHPSHLISTGPFVLSAEGSVPMATIVASVCSVVAVVATVLAVVGWKRRRQDRMHTGLVSFDS